MHGCSNKQIIVDALTEQQGQTRFELARETGLALNQVQATLYAYRKLDFRNTKDGRWYLRDGAPLPKLDGLSGSVEQQMVQLLKYEQPRSLAELSNLTKCPQRDAFIVLSLSDQFERIDRMYWLTRGRHKPESMLSDTAGEKRRRGYGGAA